MIALAALAAYHNSFSGPFIFDDESAIVKNRTIRSLWPIWPVITPIAGGGTVCGRPVLNLSFAINYALGGTSVWGYHAVNLGIHILAGCVLFGFLRRTLLQADLRGRYGVDAWGLALAISLLWMLHPIQTESVTYVVQRAESLSGLFYLLTLYCFGRGAGEGGRVWLWLSVFACAVGMGCKEVVASAPIVALLYDRTYVAGTFREAWRQRWAIYVTMAASWLLLLYFILATEDRGGTAGLAAGATTLAYFKTQCCAIFEYLRLSFWPHPLIFDYGTPVITDPMKYILPGLVITALGLATLAGIWRRNTFGFFGFWFFALLAPTSSIVAVVTQTMAAHRMYLALAPVIVLAVLGIYAKIGRKTFIICAVIALIYGWLVVQRNKVYGSELSIWGDTVLKCPGNFRALGNLGCLYVQYRKFDEAKVLLDEALRLNPNDTKSRSNLGVVLCSTGKMAEGMAEFRRTLEVDPNSVDGHLNLGVALAGQDDLKGARFHLEEALRHDPDHSLARKTLDEVRRRMAESKD